MASFDDEQAQAKSLESAKKVVKEQAFYMKRSMDGDGDTLQLVLDHAMAMLKELQTNLLSPKSYYDVYMMVQEELRQLEEHILSLQRSGRSIASVYEKVQDCSNIVPRLYLLCCVGGVYIQSQEAPANEVLTDMVEMIKGVQHPMRGLFLRNYLTQVTKNRLPDIGSLYEGVGGVKDASNFILQNFSEANRLWVRLQSPVASKDKKTREKERLDLRILVGTNLVRLSQLEGLDIEEYKFHGLPRILEEIISCKDVIAQSYLMDCIIQVFPGKSCVYVFVYVYIYIYIYILYMYIYIHIYMYIYIYICISLDTVLSYSSSVHYYSQLT
jgi:vacuolar protein sorting-associated protein 35